MRKILIIPVAAFSLALFFMALITVNSYHPKKYISIDPVLSDAVVGRYIDLQAAHGNKNTASCTFTRLGAEQISELTVKEYIYEHCWVTYQATNMKSESGLPAVVLAQKTSAGWFPNAYFEAVDGGLSTQENSKVFPARIRDLINAKEAKGML